MVNDYLEVFGSKEMKAKLPFILSRQPKIKWGSYHTGILGLAPGDENDNPLFIDELYK